MKKLVEQLQELIREYNDRFGLIDYLEQKGYEIINQTRDSIEFLLFSSGESGAEMEMANIANELGIDDGDYEVLPYKEGEYIARVYASIS